MKKCKNCKYWNTENAYAILDSDPLIQNYGDCDNPKMNYENHDGEKDNLVYADYEGHMAGISVGEDFGCIHFKEK